MEAKLISPPSYLHLLLFLFPRGTPPHTHAHTRAAPVTSVSLQPASHVSGMPELSLRAGFRFFPRKVLDQARRRVWQRGEGGSGADRAGTLPGPVSAPPPGP